MQTLLRQAWADALTLTRLRHGDDSPQWQERLQQTERIAAITAQAIDAPGGTDTALAADVEAALLQVGYHAEEAAAVARRLATPGGEDESTSRTELSARLKARARLGEHAGTPTGTSPATPRSSAEEAAYQQLSTLPFGSWFDIDTGDGTLRRQRLSWYSLLTGHALFVNPRGQKIADTDLDTLARQISAGRAQLVTEDKGRLVDRAWKPASVRCAHWPRAAHRRPPHEGRTAAGHPPRAAPPCLGPGAGHRPDARVRGRAPRQCLRNRHADAGQRAAARGCAVPAALPLPLGDGRQQAIDVGVHLLWSEPAHVPGQSWTGFRFLTLSREHRQLLRQWVGEDGDEGPVSTA